MNGGKARLSLIWVLGSSACGPATSNVTTDGGSATETSTSTGVSTTSASVTATTSSTASMSSASTTSEGTSTSAGAESTTGGPISCSTEGNNCPEGQCCHQDVPGIFLCTPFGSSCSCSTDRDCMPGEICAQTGFKGERNCVECDHDADCPQGEVCFDNICEPGATTGATTSGTGPGTSTG